MTPGLSPVSVGPIAAAVLGHRGGEAQVAAVFDRCCIVMTTNGLVTVGGTAIGDGPLNVVLGASLGPLDWIRLGVTREARGAVAHGVLSIGDDFVIDISQTPVWQPEPWPKPTRARLATALEAVRRIGAPQCPPEGLSRLVLAGSLVGADRTARAAAPTVRDFQTSLGSALRTNAIDGALVRAATLLVGLGPGLTPSGDDFLGGVLLALTALERTGMRDALWEALAPEMDDLTVGISGAHLAAAADGLAAADVHRAMTVLLASDAAALPTVVGTLRALGHSSGFDILAGIVATFDAALLADAVEPP